MIDACHSPSSDGAGPSVSGDHVLIVRIWREPNRTPPRDEDWRGHVYLSGVDIKRRFVGMDRLFRAIRTLLGQAVREDDAAETAVRSGEGEPR
ncbi:hypothetical protein LRS73_07115 [Methylobacterium currus]|uniref:hypothetical protein n=1 Tax=Methylobacterium currus TaxID=2051553 RepID=UPI001E3893F4|nr:hypothetical protein [Methylobacterium currus]UHC17639.1 hypothetical protein LRS73_07115 [Methylobacterium currus]